MKEIKIHSESTLLHIVGPQVTIDEAKEACLQHSTHCMIMVIVNDRGHPGKYFQLGVLNNDGTINVFEQFYQNIGFHHSWNGYTLNEFITAMSTSDFSGSEFYLIESFNDIFELIHERMPGWLPSESR